MLQLFKVTCPLKGRYMPANDDSDVPCSGKFQCFSNERGQIQIVATATGEVFDFDRVDLDEMIGMLAMLRMQIEAGEQ